MEKHIIFILVLIIILFCVELIQLQVDRVMLDSIDKNTKIMSTIVEGK